MSRPGSGFATLGDKVRNRPVIIFFFIVFVILTLMALGRARIDFTTSYAGAQALNIRQEGNPFWDWFQLFSIAAMPQVLTIALAYTALAIPWGDREMRWAKIVAIAVFGAAVAFDIYTGWLYYHPESRYPLAISALLDTAFSEICLTFAFGMMLDLMPDAWIQVNGWAHRFSGGRIPKGIGMSKKARPQSGGSRGSMGMPKGMPKGMPVGMAQPSPVPTPAVMNAVGPPAPRIRQE